MSALKEKLLQQQERPFKPPLEENPIYEPVDAREIQRQRNARALKRHLQEIASDWDNRINDLNTLRRGKVLRELKK